MSSATHSIGATFNSATPTLYPADLHYPAQVIDQVLETKPVLVQSLASQWISINIIPKAPSDTWLINSLSLYITGQYFKAIWGTNDYRYRIKKEIIKCVESDVDKPPIYQPGLPLPIDTEVLGFVNLKASLVLYILGRHWVIPKIFLSAISGEMRDNILSTSSFLRICWKLNGNELKSWADQWIYASGCPVFQVTAYFNRKKLTHKLTLRQLNRSKQYYEDEDHLGGEVQHETSRSEPFKRYELPSNHKNKKFKRSSRRYASSNQAPADLAKNLTETFTYPPWERSQEERDRWKVEDWTEEEGLFITQSNRDRDVVAQLEATRAIRVEAVLALVSCANIKPDSPWNIRAIPKPNQFNNFADYFIRKAIVVALSHVRDQTNNSPSVCHQFFLDQLVYNDNSLNAYSDAHYVATTIGSMTDSLMHLADDGGREQLGEIFGTKALSTGVLPDLERTCDERVLLMINELERCFMADRLVPSYRNLIAMAIIEAKLKLIAQVIDKSHPFNSLKFDHKTVTKHLRAEVGRAVILRECIIDPAVDTDVQTCLLKISEILFKPSDESVPVRIPEEKRPESEAPMPVSTKIRIHAPSAPAIEPAQSAAPLPKIILKDHQHHLTNDTDPGASSPPAPSAPDVPLKLAAALMRKPKPPPKPKKFQASGMLIPDHKMCQNLLKKLARNQFSQPFRKPVDPIRDSAPNYFNIISTPMDFKTMGLKLEMDSSLVVKYAEPLKAAFDKLWERSEKTMSAIQAKGLGGVNPARLPPPDTKLIVTPNNVVPLAPPPSFAAFAAGGSMIPPSSSPPKSPGLPPLPAPPRMSPEASRPGRLKVKLKPRTSISNNGTTSEIIPDNHSSIPPAPKSGLKIKFTPTSTTSNLANPPSTPADIQPEGERSKTSAYTSPPFPTSSSSTFPPPPPPIMISMAPPKSLPPPPPTFVPPPPPPSFESFSLAAQKPTPASSRPEKPSVEIETSNPVPTKSKKRPSSSQTMTTAVPDTSGARAIDSTASPGPSIGSSNLSAPPPPSLPELDPKCSKHPTASVPSIPALKPQVNPPPPSNPIKIKVVQWPAPRPVAADHSEAAMPSILPNSSKSKSKMEKSPKSNSKSKGARSVTFPTKTHLESHSPNPVDSPGKTVTSSSPPTKKSKTKRSILPEYIDQSSGHRSSPPALPKTPDLGASGSPSHISRSPSASTAAGRSVTLAHPPSTSILSEPVKAASPVADDLLNSKKAKVIIRKMMEHPHGV
ncbi:hypothetical protein PtB15_8B128 [Puccinia triticina]|nr:hypothetical protein PtB15_8B128 [Puccinia triticina]